MMNCFLIYTRREKAQQTLSQVYLIHHRIVKKLRHNSILQFTLMNDSSSTRAAGRDHMGEEETQLLLQLSAFSLLLFYACIEWQTILRLCMPIDRASR